MRLPSLRSNIARVGSSRSAAHMRLLAAALCFLAALQLVAGVAAAAVPPAQRSCVVPMPCCDKGFCPLHAHGSHRHSNSGPRWLRCDVLTTN